MKITIANIIAVVCLPAISCYAVIDGENTLSINFTDPNDANAKAIWSEPNLINVTSQGLGWDGQSNGCRNFWLQSTEVAIGLSWRPVQGAHIAVELEPLLKPMTLENGQTYTPSAGAMFVRHSPDAKHWSSWQMMMPNGQKNAKYQYAAEVGIPQGDRTEYTKYIYQYLRSDVPWPSDEEAMVKWIVARDPNFFEKPPPFIGYVQVRYDGCVPGNQRLARLKVIASWGVGGMHTPPKDEKLRKDREGPWRQGQKSGSDIASSAIPVGGKIDSFLADKSPKAIAFREALKKASEEYGQVTIDKDIELNALLLFPHPDVNFVGASGKQSVSDYAWGEAVDGLRLGLRCPSGDRPYRIGETVRYEVVLENTTDHEIILESLSPSSIKWSANVKDDKIFLVRNEMNIGNGIAGIEKMTIAPRSGWHFGTIDYRIVPLDSDEKNTLPILQLKPGKYSVSTQLVFASISSNKAWAGKVISGKMYLNVAADDVSWGEDVNGLRLGLGFDLQDRPYRQGEIVRFKVCVRNTSDKMINLVHFGLRGWLPTILNSQGKAVPVTSLPIDEPVQKQNLSLRPGETKPVGTVFLKIDSEPQLDSKGTDPHCYLTPGSYYIQQKFTFREDAEANWFGELATEKLAIEIVPNEQKPAVQMGEPNKAASAFPVGGKLDAELLGEQQPNIGKVNGYGMD